ncbi:nuclear exosome regulator NRDE2 [Stomoxys calcitrans]|uniref:Protein NRDE2 homolog n=1 Tax=Stomoxys calcitrans TaxID=35570 RepID=A0A1I8Q8N2_STOCA|nr:nuclear exosome regulator NRDE2 [Stomoxys calcitrans]
MSLFPAYSDETQSKQFSETLPNSTATSSQWLENTSFPAEGLHLASQGVGKALANPTSETDTSVDSCDNEVSSNSRDSLKQITSSRKKEKLKKHTIQETRSANLLDFTGNEDFYVDKKRANQYNAVRTLHKPACPRYRIKYQVLGPKYFVSAKQKSKRYYHNSSLAIDGEKISDTKCYPLTENEYTLQLGELNRKTVENCRDIQSWLDLIVLQDRNPYKWSRLRVAEKKIDYIEKALKFHPSNDELYKVYIATITQCYTSHDVSKMLDAMLSKDPHNLNLWQAQIMCTQGTMARCTVPDVMRIYERCMKKIFHKQVQPSSSAQLDSDSVMMHLFYTLSLFLRQSGLYEQFFALIKLGIELNIPDNTAILDDLQPRIQDETTLVEYEELILQSGLPMNEIWLRVEKLRQGFYFLPFPGDSAKCSDPQRIVFNEDVCHYVYPLKSRENSFKLLLLILKLLKLPFIHTHCLTDQLEGDTDAIEDMLAVYVNPNYNWCSEQMDFFQSLYDFSKEMACSPTFLNHCIGHELYTDCLQKFLTNCSKAYEQVDERKRLVFLMLWCRFHHLLLILEKINKKFNADFAKKGRKMFKALLKHQSNRKCLTLYVEFARYEYEAEAPMEMVDNIFKSLIESYNQDENLSSELAYAYLTYAEILLKSQDIRRACQLISAYALECNVDNDIPSPRKLIALNIMKEKVEQIIKIEESVRIMLLEQYILPDNTLTQVKMYCLLLYALNQKQQALEYMQKILLKFNFSGNPRHQFLREQCFEIYVNLLQLPGGNSYISYSLVQQSIAEALKVYPNNVFLLHKWGSQSSLPWYKLRKGYMTIDPSIKCVILLIALARCRFIRSLSLNVKSVDSRVALMATHADIGYHEVVVRQRVLNLFKFLMQSHMSSTVSSTQPLFTSLRRNSLFWRCYLRCLSDQSCSFELSKQCLLTALDECPWSKALYLDGATFVPQELSHLQDLIIEKQLRIYALPEELEILRER